MHIRHLSFLLTKFSHLIKSLNSQSCYLCLPFSMSMLLFHSKILGKETMQNNCPKILEVIMILLCPTLGSNNLKSFRSIHYHKSGIMQQSLPSILIELYSGMHSDNNCLQKLQNILTNYRIALVAEQLYFH